MKLRTFIITNYIEIKEKTMNECTDPQKLDLKI